MIESKFDKAWKRMQEQNTFGDELSCHIIAENLPYAIDLLREAGTHIPYYVNRELIYDTGSATDFVRPRIAFERSHYALKPESDAILNVSLRIEGSLSRAMQQDESADMSKRYHYREAIKQEILQCALAAILVERMEIGKLYESCIIPLPGQKGEENPIKIEVFIEKPEDWGAMLQGILRRDRAAALRRETTLNADAPPEPQRS